MAVQAPKTVEYMAREGQGPMSEQDFKAVVSAAISDSVQFVDGELSPDRAKATKYYLGEPFGNEEEGRSQVVLTEVRDAVDGILPSLLRVFFGAEHTVEFVPTRADTVQQAEQKTDYVRYVFEEDNAGFLRTYDVLKDGLIRKIGIFKWGWDESEDTKAYRMEGVTEDELAALADDESVTLSEVVKRKPPKNDPEAALLYDIEITRTQKDGRARVWSVPPEEFIYNREARSLAEARLVGHRTRKTRGELLAMGIPEALIEAHGGSGDSSLAGNEEELARREVISGGQSNDPEMGKANDKILYTEIAFTVDFNGDGKAELRRICTIGPGYYPVKNVPTDEKPFALFCPYPEPHTLTGGSMADRTMDMQKLNSSLMRAMLDSAAASIFPRTVYQEGQASVADIMNTAIGAPIRERMAGTVRVLEMPFTGKEMMPIMQFTQGIIERRTGRNKGVAGLEADALQSTGKEAVGAVLSGSQEQIEIIARIFAEGTLKPLFRGLGRLIQTRQPRERMVRLRGKWVEVDPKAWAANMDVTVNVALGTTFTEKKVATLMAVAGEQKELLTTMGLSNPAVTLPQFLNTRAKILSLQGIKDSESYYAKLPMDWQPPPPPQPAPTPDELWTQAEKEMTREKNIKELAIKQDELDLKRQELALRIEELNLKKSEAIADQAFEAAKLDLEREVEAAKAELERTRIEADLTIALQAAEVEANKPAPAEPKPQSLVVEQFGIDDIKESLGKTEQMIVALADHAQREKPPIVVPAPMVTVNPTPVTVPAPIVNMPAAPKRGKRKIRIKKDGDGYTAESED